MHVKKLFHSIMLLIFISSLQLYNDHTNFQFQFSYQYFEHSCFIELNFIKLYCNQFLQQPAAYSLIKIGDLLHFQCFGGNIIASKKLVMMSYPNYVWFNTLKNYNIYMYTHSCICVCIVTYVQEQNKIQVLQKCTKQYTI